MPRFLFLIAPLFFLLLGFRTVNAGFLEVLIYYLPSFVCLFLGYTIVSRGIRHSFWSEVYETAQCVYLMYTTIWTCLNPGRAKFRVTPKGTMTDRLNFNWYIVFPQILIAALIFIGLVMGVVRALYTPEYWGGILTNLFWSGYNLILLLGAIYVAQERPQLRIAPRVSKRIRCEVRLLDGTIAVGYTTNISESGVAIVFEAPVPITGTVALKLLDWDINESSVFSVQAVRSQVDRSGRHYVGFRVVNRTELQHQKLIRHMFGTAEVWTQDYIYTRPSFSFLNLIFTPFRLAATVEHESKRRTTRFQTTLSCMIEVDGRYLSGYTNEISESGLSIVIKDERSVQKGQTHRIRIQWSDEHISELTAQVVRLEPAGGGQVKIGMNFVNLTREQRLDVIHQVYKPWEGLVRVAPAVNKLVRCSIKLENGNQIHGISQEISEMGVVISPQTRTMLRPDEKVTVQFYWDDNTVSSFRGVYMDTLDRGGGQTPGLLVYFDHLDIKTLDALSQKIHEPIESKVFHTLNAV
jgi:c-di-GMP-binding flagellar brake protein YcgR